MKAGDPADTPKDARLEDQRAFGVPTVLNDPKPEVRQCLQKQISPLAVREVVQLQVAGSDPEVEVLPLGILSNTTPAVKVGAIVLMDGVTVDTKKPTVGDVELVRRCRRGSSATSSASVHERGVKWPCMHCSAPPGTPPVSAVVPMAAFR
jgi:hypothetical protein